jgi:pantoate--beta-alanine ligase
MRTARSVSALRELRASWSERAERIAFVPTMGNLHDGHLALVRRGLELADRVVVSIFVNPLQFDRPEDLEAYPRTLDEDYRALEDSGVDLVFVPEVDEVYPIGREATRVVVPGVSEPLEGEHRVGHFSGVATVVTKLFNMVQPQIAVFGEKDYQQLLVVRRLVQDLDLPIEIESVPTVRDSDGLALSSRNRYLSPDERRRAPALYRVLSEVAAAVAERPEQAARLEAEARVDLGRAGLRPDYLAVCDAGDLGPPNRLGRSLRVLAAAWLGQTRLIDNVPVAGPERP